MTFWKQFKPKSCSVSLKAKDKTEAIEEIVSNLVNGGVLPKALEEDARAALAERENLASTGVGMNVAIPHVKLSGLEKAACSLSVHKDGLEWAAVDGAVVHVFFTILRPEEASDEHDPEQHLEMMKWIARLGRDADFRRFAVRSTTKAELVDLLKEMSAV